MGQGGAKEGPQIGVEGRTHMKEVMAEDETLIYRRSVMQLKDNAYQEIDRKVTERLRFCCEEKWKDYLRCMEGRNLSKTPECEALREIANVCVERLDRQKIKATMSKRYVMGFFEGESRTRGAIQVTRWREIPGGSEAPSPEEQPQAAASS
eukprot:TRINITY_DN16654_c0_g1_i1.p1 TRINITY_DN16654_c0_g1~~TRINITY_DN16654_c0_g1_i1.p1  ORF type:complete len:151 (+),score=28.99 TRINITY_DN16654_c0_g1_i1:148-600(+)